MKNFLKRGWELWRDRPQSITYLCEQWDARYGIPRPAAAPHMPAYQAARQFVGICGEGVLLIAAGILTAVIWVWIIDWVPISMEFELACRAISLGSLYLSAAEAATLPLPYYQLYQRSTYGTSRWADPILLKDLKLARQKSEALPPGELPLGGIGTQYEVVLNEAQTMCHLAVFGPPGSGKSATFFMSWLRAWSQTGSAIVLDPKGELYDQTAYRFENVYRIDFQDPERTDRWNFLPACRDDAELAHEAASIILNVDSSRPTTADPFWKEAETAALTAILLYLAQANQRPTPAMIQQFVSIYSLKELNEMMMASPDPHVPLYWGMFTKVEPKLQGGVLIGLGVRCAAFNIPNAKAISAPITSPMAARGIRPVSFADLRCSRTAIYVVVPEGDASRYKVVLATLFGLAAGQLRKGDLSETAAPVLFNFDEAGNIFIHGLSELLGVGRGRRLCVALGYQNIGQVYQHYGSDGGDAILGSVGTMIFLPGLDHRTAEYASKRIGQATVWQSSSIDVKEGTRFDSERSAEVGRALMDPAEVRQMVKHRQAVAIIGNAPPVRFSYPQIAKLQNPPLCKREQHWCRGDVLAPSEQAPIDSDPPPQSVAVARVEKREEILNQSGRPVVSFGQLRNDVTLPAIYNTEPIEDDSDPSIEAPSDEDPKEE